MQKEYNVEAAKAVKIEAEIANLNALTAKAAAETFKLNQESRFYLLFVGSAITAAIATLAKVVW